MQSPADEMKGAVVQIMSAPTPERQKLAINRYFLSDAALRHPFYSVTGGPLSRERILSIYQWSRVLFSKIDVEVESVAYDKDNRIVTVDLIQYNHFYMFPFKPSPRRYVCRFTLNEEGGNFYIAKEEDFFYPDNLAALVLPPFVPVGRYMQSAGSVAINVLTKITQIFGLGRAPTDTEPTNIENSHRDEASPSEEIAKENRKRPRVDGQEGGQRSLEESSTKRGKKDGENENKEHESGEMSESRNVNEKKKRAKRRGANGAHVNDRAQSPAAGGCVTVKEEN